MCHQLHLLRIGQSQHQLPKRLHLGSFFLRSLASANTPLPVPPAAWKIISTPEEYIRFAVVLPRSALSNLPYTVHLLRYQGLLL